MIKKNNFLFFLGFILVLLFSGLLLISNDFVTTTPLADRPVIYLITLLIFSSIVYFLSVYFRSKEANSSKLLIYIFLIGLILRLLMVISVPMLENDFNRYLWDGAVTSNNISPYQYSPEEIKSSDFKNTKLKELSSESNDVFYKINHPHLKTIYPTVTQLFFALSYKISPWDLEAWKLVLLFFDLLTFLIIYKILKILCIPVQNILIYWWNPLLIKEIFNSGHFEVIAFPFVLGALILVIKKKYFLSAFSLAVSVGVKIWPLIIFPLIIRPIKNFPIKIFNVIAFFLVLMVFIFFPIYEAGFDKSSGYLAYSKSWENNSSLFKVVLFSFEYLFNIIDIHSGHAQKYARLVIGLLVSIWVLFQTFFRNTSGKNLFERALFIVAALFLLSPTQFPWYYTWIIPFLAIIPRWSLMFLTLTLPLYYTRFYLEPRGQLEIFKNLIVWIEFVPVWILILLEWRKGLFRAA